MDATTSFFAVIAILILLAAVSLRFGVDSRDSFTTKEHEVVLRGLAVGPPACPRPEHRVDREQATSTVFV